MLSKVKVVAESQPKAQNRKSKGQKSKVNEVKGHCLHPVEDFGNDASLEEIWAIKAMDHAEVYFNLITSVQPSCLQLTPIDDEIYYGFRQLFPHLHVDILTDDILKSPIAKMEWRCFAEMFEYLEDFSFGTLMRANAKMEFSPENCLLVFRVQFLAIEIARNREGINDEVYRKFRPPPKQIKQNT